MSGENANTHEELRLLYEVSVKELEFFKRQQWSVTNYALLLYAAVVGVARLLNGNVSGAEKLVFCLVATGVAVLGSYILWVLNNSIVVRKARLSAVRKNFSTTFHSAWTAKEKLEEALSIYGLLMAVVVIGALTVWWLVYLKL
ncbi:MAG: hypothetical protein AMJ68_04875 [Acidithiobacillales bacterium SG8_45]|jgi:hypothetical protein|nr:MAG: hypothetical protein AMJ68_04875 [Acidithiobacillales bacterium SG8_45]